jgi:hypothetical protein
MSAALFPSSVRVLDELSSDWDLTATALRGADVLFPAPDCFVVLSAAFRDPAPPPLLALFAMIVSCVWTLNSRKRRRIRLTTSPALNLLNTHRSAYPLTTNGSP